MAKVTYCDICGEVVNKGEYPSHVYLTMDRVSNFVPDREVYDIKDEFAKLSMDLCDDCAIAIKRDIIDMKNKMAMRKKEDKHGYEKIQEAEGDDSTLDQIREAVRNGRACGRIR